MNDVNLYDNNRKFENVDLARFIAAIIILVFHVPACGITTTNCVWTTGNRYVEFFFIMTGFLTTRHFDGFNSNNTIKSSIEYTAKKFSKIWIYTSIITVLHWVLFGIGMMVHNAWTIKDFVFSFLTDFIFDVLLLTSGWKMPLIGSLWFVSSMLLVFPLFCVVLQLKNRYWILTISFIAWYVPFSLGYMDSFEMLIRAFANLSLGAVMYEILYICYEYLKKVKKLILTAIEITFFILPIIITFLNLDVYRFLVFSFFVSQIIMFSGLSYTSNIRGNIFNFLGRLSLPIYIVQLTVGETIAELFKNCSDVIKQTLYYVGTIIVAMLFMLVVENLWKKLTPFIRHYFV